MSNTSRFLDGIGVWGTEIIKPFNTSIKQEVGR
jgi:hypothetical protein